MSPLQKVVFLPRAVSPVWAASAPLWAPCLLPTCMSTPSLSTTKYPMTSMRGPLATPLFPRPAEWPVPTSAAWGPSPSWSLPRTGMGPLCKAELGSVSAHFDCHYSIHCSTGICEGANEGLCREIKVSWNPMKSNLTSRTSTNIHKRKTLFNRMCKGDWFACSCFVNNAMHDVFFFLIEGPI